MPYQVVNPSKQDQRALIHLLSAEGCQPAGAHRPMSSVSVAASVWKRTAVNWLGTFRTWRQGTTDRVQDKLNVTWWEVLKHPAYSPDLPPRVVHVVEPLKEVPRGRAFKSEDNLQEAVKQWSRQQPEEFFTDDICRFMHQWDPCLNACYDFNCWNSPEQVLLNMPCR
jgi:hypothetical protein